MNGNDVDRRGLIAAAAAYMCWGVVPLYWHLLRSIPSTQIIAHRILWSALLVAGWLTLKSGARWVRSVWAQPRALGLLGLSSLIIAFNWGLYIWAVNAGHVVECSLGYFINPLVNVLIGVGILRERLRAVQWLAVGCAFCGVAWLTWRSGAPPWIALGLALSFGIYGLIRKIVAVEATAGLGIEGTYLVIPAAIFVLWSENGHGGGFFGNWSWGHDLLLVLGGVVSAIPLIAFAYGVRRIPLSLAGLLQYIAPTMQLLLGVWFFQEPFDRDHAIGFAAIWLGLLIFGLASMQQWRRQRMIARRTST